MQELYPEIEINHFQAEAIARGLFAVARADGHVHPREAALIEDFFNSTTDRPADLTALEREPDVTGETLAAQLPTRPLRELFLKSAILLAYADGGYGAGEAKVIAGFVRAFGMTDAERVALEDEVKDYLLKQLSHLANVEGVAQVGKELKV